MRFPHHFKDVFLQSVNENILVNVCSLRFKPRTPGPQCFKATMLTMEPPCSALVQLAELLCVA